MRLLDALDDAQRKQAVLGYQVRDLARGPGRDGRTIQPEGVKGSALTEKQREMMLDIAGEWTGIMSDEIAKTKLEEMKKNLAETWFAWSGPTEKGSAAYFRIQGPTVVIEYAPQRGSGGSHIHTIYRDPTNDYGRADQEMRPRVVVAAALVMCVAAPASAHRLDEYLQAAVLNVERERAEIDMWLTPGVEVFGKVLAAMDANTDGAISAAKQRAYAKKLARDLTLSIDGVRLPLVLRSFTFPDVADMRQGIGQIELNFEARTPPGGSHRTLVFENRHLPEISVYLANCLVPADPDICITVQHRNYVQSVYRVEYEQGDLARPRCPANRRRRRAGWSGREADRYSRPIFTRACGTFLPATTICCSSPPWCWRRRRFGI